MLLIPLILSIFMVYISPLVKGEELEIINHTSYINKMEKECRIRPYYKSELAEAYAPFLTTHSALNRLALWIDLNAPLSKALAQTGYRRTQRIFTSRQVALIFEYLGEP